MKQVERVPTLKHFYEKAYKSYALIANYTSSLSGLKQTIVMDWRVVKLKTALISHIWNYGVRIDRLY